MATAAVTTTAKTEKQLKAEARRKQMLPLLIAVPVGITAYFTLLAPKATGIQWFTLHPLLMMLAFLTLGGLGALTKKIGGRDNTLLHGAIMFAGSVVAVLGFDVVYTDKESSGGVAHLTTVHSQLGAATLTLFLLYPVASFVLFNPDSGLLRTHKLARAAHKLGGRLLIGSGLVTCCLGILALEKNPIVSAALIAALLGGVPFFLL